MKPEIVLAHRYSKFTGFIEKRNAKKECNAFEKKLLMRGVKTIFMERGTAYILGKAGGVQRL